MEFCDQRNITGILLLNKGETKNKTQIYALEQLKIALTFKEQALIQNIISYHMCKNV